MIQQNIKNKKSGFTIVELLVVIVVIGILAAITIVSYTGVTTKARAAQAQSNATAVQSVIEVMNADNGVYPISLAAIQAGSTTTKLPTGVTLSSSEPTASNGTNNISYKVCGTTSPATSSTILGGRIGYWDFNSSQVKYVYVGSGVVTPSGSTTNCLTAYADASA